MAKRKPLKPEDLTVTYTYCEDGPEFEDILKESLKIFIESKLRDTFEKSGDENRTD